MPAHFTRKRAAAVLILGITGAFLIPMVVGSRAVDPPSIPSDVTDPSAVEDMERARAKVGAEPTSGKAWGELGLEFRGYGFEEESARCFREAERLDPNNPAWPYLLALPSYDTNPDEARKRLERALHVARKTDEVSAVRLRLAELELQTGRRAEAKALLEAELFISPSSPRAHYVLAGMALESDAPAVAIEHLKHVERSPFNRVRVAGLMAAAYGRLGRSREGAEYAMRAVGTAPEEYWPDPFIQMYANRGKNRDALMNKAMSLFKSGMATEAINTLEAAAARYPDVQSLVILGDAWTRLGDLDEAVRAYRRAIAVDEQSPEPWAKLGTALLAQGDSFLQQRRGTEARERHEGSRDALRRALALKPWHNTANLDLARAQIRLGDVSNAEESCREALRVNPANADACVMLGELLLESKRPAEAIPMLESALRFAKDPARINVLLEKARTGSKP